MTQTVPTWSEWRTSDGFTVGVEEEVMLVGRDGAIACRVEEVVAAAPPDLAVVRETHGCAVEIATPPRAEIADAVADLSARRAALRDVLSRLDLSPAVAGTHPYATTESVRVTRGEHQQEVVDDTRGLTRREPTFALHVHVALPDPETAVRTMNRMRAHVPLLLALSANSPFWHGRDSGLASARTPTFDAFPRTGLPRAFDDYGDLVRSVELLVGSGAIPDPSFVWWDLRVQPRFGTLEVRCMDAQTETWATAALVGLVRALVHAESKDGLASAALLASPEALAENRFIALRDGHAAQLIDVDRACLVGVDELLSSVLDAVGPVEGIERLLADPPAERQRAVARAHGLDGVVEDLVERY